MASLLARSLRRTQRQVRHTRCPPPGSGHAQCSKRLQDGPGPGRGAAGPGQGPHPIGPGPLAGEAHTIGRSSEPRDGVVLIAACLTRHWAELLKTGIGANAGRGAFTHSRVH